MSTGTLAPARAPRLAPTAVLLDLDGTLSHSGPVITRCVAETLARHGYPAQTPEELLRFVGPPSREGFAEFGGVPEEELTAVVATYRTIYPEHMLEAELFPGVPELVGRLHAAGLPLAVATSKLRHLAVRILEDAGLAGYFSVICGATPDESRSTKADIVEDALAGLRAAGADVGGAVMVGDRHHDVDGAATHGVPTVLVGWGYGQPGEERGARATAATPEELAALLLGADDGASPG
ncbi:HAD hydrolase-like protein [Georgenia sp. AZ-5]|uniref:HAD hydrolase-like protein n=1 Tax=Georgenia sp. AZ-5 TaxID=3367526 RepID=UPI0037542FFB